MIYITPSEVIEYMFCPRFIYYMNVLKIEQNEEDRHLVIKGRNIHNAKMVQNKDYIRKKIGCVDKKIDEYLISEKLRLKGRIDEVLFFENNLAAPLDYKYSFWQNKIFTTYKMQQALYSLLIEENYKKKVERAYLVYVRTKNKLIEIKIGKQQKDKAKKTVEEIFEILEKNYFPNPTKYKNKCFDCTYKNLCEF
ncbi:MAG: CRISPR-associated protein Cas4 [Desulfobacteraceae bacterium 4572_130]|nr:MAG: CRISPR-associated protein Cas4 [Desulfobacteraceae bacterium 4572_130]